jgi:hypothetical protein
MIVAANPALNAGELGRSARPRQMKAPTSAVQPSAWWRNAAREKSQGFCSWIRNAVPETTSANGSVSSHTGFFSFPRTRPSCAAPASIIV